MHNLSIFVICFAVFIGYLYFQSGKSKDSSKSVSRIISPTDQSKQSSAKIQQLEFSLKSSLEEGNQLKLDLKSSLEKHSQLKLDLKNSLKEHNELSEKYQVLLSDYESVKSKLDAYLNHLNKDIEHIFKNNTQAFSYVAVLYADYLLLDYENAENFLLHKKRPALGEGLRIGALKSQTKSYLIELNRTKYQLKYLLSLYPQLEDLFDSENDVSTPSKEQIIPDDTWSSLSESQKSQMMLNRYLSRPKSKWEIGRDYELYVGYRYSLQGYHVDYFGSNNGLEDLGRDLIIEKGNEIGIIQCKYWASKKLIHEKHIAQLYGTLVSYIIENNYLPTLVHGVLVTNISLSNTAKKFASFLDIKYKECYPMGDFPRIKCNVNTDTYGLKTKIYHLPTDQQYDTVKISHPEECFVFTVEEAEKLGFRHAYKWHNT